MCHLVIYLAFGLLRATFQPWILAIWWSRSPLLQRPYRVRLLASMCRASEKIRDWGSMFPGLQAFVTLELVVVVVDGSSDALVNRFRIVVASTARAEHAEDILSGLGRVLISSLVSSSSSQGSYSQTAVAPVHD